MSSVRICLVSRISSLRFRRSVIVNTCVGSVLIRSSTRNGATVGPVRRVNMSGRSIGMSCVLDLRFGSLIALVLLRNSRDMRSVMGWIRDRVSRGNRRVILIVSRILRPLKCRNVVRLITRWCDSLLWRLLFRRLKLGEVLGEN